MLLGLALATLRYRGRRIDIVASLLAGCLVFFFSYFRKLGFADDLGYVRILSQVQTSFANSSEKWGIAYKLLVKTIDFAGLLSVQGMLSLGVVAMALACIAIGTNATLSFALIFFSMQIALLIQNRQAFSLVFTVLAILCSFPRPRWPRTLLLITASLSHISVAPFAIAVMITPRLLRRIPIAWVGTMAFIGALCVYMVAKYALSHNGYEWLESQVPQLTVYTSKSTMLLGNVGIGGITFYILLGIFIIASNRGHGSYSIPGKLYLLGFVFYGASAIFPLLQRVHLPFLLVGIIHFVRIASTRLKITLVIATFLYSLSQYNKFAHWQFCTNCQHLPVGDDLSNPAFSARNTSSAELR